MARLLASLFSLLLLCSYPMTTVFAQSESRTDDLDCNDDDDIDDIDDSTVAAELTGYCEVPSISTGGQGRFRAEISDSSITWTLSYANLEAPVEQAHIHLGQEHTNGGIVAFLCTNLGNATAQACPQGSGDINGMITAADVVGPTEQGITAGEYAELVRAIRAGAAYVNIHTQTYPTGEIRGQVVDGDDDADDDDDDDDDVD